MTKDRGTSQFDITADGVTAAKSNWRAHYSMRGSRCGAISPVEMFLSGVIGKVDLKGDAKEAVETQKNGEAGEDLDVTGERDSDEDLDPERRVESGLEDKGKR
jgi:hypothetical protein